MKIGVDISQIVHEGTGVARYVEEMIREAVAADSAVSWVLFGTSLRKRSVFEAFYQSLSAHHDRVRLVTLPIPPSLLHILWNVFHVVPVEWFVGAVDVFWSSDWTQPPLARAAGVTTIHDVSFLRFPESFPAQIVEVQTRRLARAAKACALFLCDSVATRDDVVKFLGIPKGKLRVVYPGFSHL